MVTPQSLDVSELVRGVSRADGGRRLPSDLAITLPADTWEAAGLLPGSRLEFLCDGDTELVIDYDLPEAIGATASILPQEFSLARRPSGREP